MSIEELYHTYKQYPCVQTDSRQLKAGDFFFALKGPHFNGNTFARRAIELGAAYALVDEAEFVTSEQIILVDNVLSTLQQLAACHREHLKKRNIPVLAITGSNGKTTTKELVHAVLSTTYKTYTTTGNLNNHIGVPLTILKIKDDVEIAVIEMGANHIGEIKSYCEYAMPTHGLITNCGLAHLEGFGSAAGVRQAKGELYDYLAAHNGTAFIMWDYDYLRDMSKHVPHHVLYGTKEAQFMAKALTNEAFLTFTATAGLSEQTITTQLVGAYNLPNALAAIAIGATFQVPEQKIIQAIEQYVPSNSRSQLMEWSSNKIIMDAYNANPSSMAAAIENFARHPATNKVLVLGAMAELGLESLQEHKKIIDLISQYDWKNVLLVGGDFYTAAPSSYNVFKNVAEAKDWFSAQDFKDSYILIKGSRSSQMEKILEK